MQHNLFSLKELTILFIEDDEIMLKESSEMLKVFFSDVFTASTAKRGYEMYEDKSPNIILTDIGLPDMNGLSLVKKIREKDAKTPIVVLSSYSDQKILLEAANSKIDGYIVKPIVLNELIVKLLDALQRGENKVSSVTLKDGVMYNFKTRELSKNGESTFLQEKENLLLIFFIENQVKISTKQEIMSHIWPLENVTDSALKNLLSRFRSKIGDDMLISVKGTGWKLKMQSK